MALPYETATSGKTATDDMQKILRAFGASSFGVMENFEQGTLTVQFEWKERRVTLTASSDGYAAAWLREHPHTSRSRSPRIDWERKAKAIGQTAVYSILRDWIKGQVTAVGTGVLSFEGAFLGQILLPTGQTILERVTKDKLLAMPSD